jgi:hypothetical protein
MNGTNYRLMDANATPYHAASESGGVMAAFSTQQIMLMMMPTLIHACTGLLTGLLSSISLSAGLLWLVQRIMRTKQTHTKELRMDYVVRGGLSGQWIADSDHMHNAEGIQSVLEFISERGVSVDCRNGSLIMGSVSCKDSESYNARMKTRPINIVPAGVYTWQDISIQYILCDGTKDAQKKTTTTTTSADGGGAKPATITKTIVLTSQTRSIMDMRAFVMECYHARVDRIYPITETRTKRHAYYQIASDKNRPIFRQYTYGYCTPATAFDALFIPAHHLRALRTLLDKLLNKKIKKLVILLTGLPGAGKTSTERAIVEYLDRDCVVGKLSRTENDEQLMDLFFSDTLNVKNGQDTWVVCNVNPSQRVLLLADVDAETKVLNQRVEEEKKSKTKQSALSFDGSSSSDSFEQLEHSRRDKSDEDKSDTEQSDTEQSDTEQSDTKKIGSEKPMSNGNMVAAIAEKLVKASEARNSFTMSGYLNAVDGFLQLQEACLLIDTNHPELLDKAVKRCGRVTYTIHLGRMLACDAHRMVRHYFDGASVREDLVRDDEILSADLTALCQRCVSIAELEEEIPNIIHLQPVPTTMSQ